MKVGFVILCYGNFPMIQECVSRLLTLEHIQESELILVDNASPDGTGKKLVDEYKEFANIHVLLNKENSGFAKGNNLGYAYARNELVKLHADSEINRPNVEKLIKAKRAFFQSVDGEFRKYSKSDQKRIQNAHYYEIVFQALKAKKFGVALKYMLKAGISPQSVKDLMKRYKER